MNQPWGIYISNYKTMVGLGDCVSLLCIAYGGVVNFKNTMSYEMG